MHKSVNGQAEIPHLDRRASHGLRRLLAGEAEEATGDPWLAMLSIGDKDIRQASR